MSTILVCYATRYGSTIEIARIIGEELESAGHILTVRRIAEVENPGEYDAIIIGSPLYMGKWLAEARDFVSRYRFLLKERPVAVFSTGFSFRDRTHEHLRSGERAIDEIRIFFTPISAGFFPGKVDPDPMSPADRAIVKLGKVTPGDFRDENLVRSWARSLAETLLAGKTRNEI